MKGRDRPQSSNTLVIARGNALHQFVLETFAATGRSPTLAQVQERFSLGTLGDADAMVAELARTGAVHRDPGDSTITHAYPFSNEPTAHRVRLEGGTGAYAMCAIDALGMPFMLRKDAEIISACAGCGADVRVEVRGASVSAHAPDGMVVWLGEMAEGCVAATDLCPDLNFFCSPACIGDWSRAHPEKRGARLDLDEAVKRGRQVFEALLATDDHCNQ
jgi:hypothetical protein